MRPSGRGFRCFPYLWSGGSPVRFPEGSIVKGPSKVLGYLFMDFKAKPWCSTRAKFAAWQPMVCREPGLHLWSGKNNFFERPLLLAQLMLSFPWTQSQRETVKHTYIKHDCQDWKTLTKWRMHGGLPRYMSTSSLWFYNPRAYKKALLKHGCNVDMVEWYYELLTHRNLHTT